ncbi:hypothetical protein niasHT_024944 [Heterodera trifolii]|uniref:MATH domain-containing protein n=1 Tax=Heterodera trifolii TaxID=157864 RepID=A0ABD2JAC2_9BILA
MLGPNRAGQNVPAQLRMKPFMFKKSTLVLIIVVLLLLLIIGVALAIALLVTASAEKETSKSPLDVLDPTPFGTVRCKGCTSTTSTASSTSTTPAPTTRTTALPNEEHRSEAMPDSTSLFKLALAPAAAIFYSLLSRRPSKDLKCPSWVGHICRRTQPRPRLWRCPTQTKRAGTSSFFVQLDELYKMISMASGCVYYKWRKLARKLIKLYKKAAGTGTLSLGWTSPESGARLCPPADELLDPSKGFYNKDEDKVKLAIDFIVDEPEEKFVSDPNKSNGTLSMEIEKISEFAREIIESERRSKTLYIKGMPWKILADIQKKNENNEKWLGFFLLCDASEKDGNWSRKCSATLRIVSQKSDMEDFKIEFNGTRIFNNEEPNRGFGDFISFEELMDPSKGLYNKEEDKVTLTIDVIMDEPKTAKIISDPNKSNGTLSMQIEKLSEFVREINLSERKSETVTYVKGMPWKILAQIKTENESTDNEKWLGFSLLCDVSEEEKFFISSKAFE